MKGLNVRDFDYNLPADRIAQKPLKRRGDSRMLVVRRDTGDLDDSEFRRLPEYLDPGDVVVINDCWVMPGRLRGEKQTGGRIELTLLGNDPDVENCWECMVKASKPPKPGATARLGESIRVKFIEERPLDISIGSDMDRGLWLIRLSSQGDLQQALLEEGLPPLPPYIRRSLDDDSHEDRSRYQTVYARSGRAAAAPTAGLHFEKEMLEALLAKGVGLASVTLEVGLGTFAPVRVENVEDHRMHPERYHVSNQAAETINQARASGKRCLAVGTTAVRTLEHQVDHKGIVQPGSGQTDLFIYPGYRFSVIDVLLTNFHLPRSTLLMLVSAFGGRDLILKAYDKALELGYRFLSYGDAMLII